MQHGGHHRNVAKGRGCEEGPRCRRQSGEMGATQPCPANTVYTFDHRLLHSSLYFELLVACRELERQVHFSLRLFLPWRQSGGFSRLVTPIFTICGVLFFDSPTCLPWWERAGVPCCLPVHSRHEIAALRCRHSQQARDCPPVALGWGASTCCCCSAAVCLPGSPCSFFRGTS